MQQPLCLYDADTVNHWEMPVYSCSEYCMATGYKHMTHASV